MPWPSLSWLHVPALKVFTCVLFLSLPVSVYIFLILSCLFQVVDVLCWCLLVSLANLCPCKMSLQGLLSSGVSDVRCVSWVSCVLASLYILLRFSCVSMCRMLFDFCEFLLVVLVSSVFLVGQCLLPPMLVFVCCSFMFVFVVFALFNKTSLGSCHYFLLKQDKHSLAIGLNIFADFFPRSLYMWVILWTRVICHEETMFFLYTSDIY